jgi:uncharacterized membrane protein YgcG
VVASTTPSVLSPPLSFRRHPQVLAKVGLACALLVYLFSWPAYAFDFPPLTGRIVDQAGVISATARGEIETKLKDLEDKSGIQLVVATVKSLQGGDIETYANELFRTWKLGEAKKNNGVLLLVAPADHKVRIEVGYGLEGTLTDALAQVIIASAMVPRFKANDYSGGIERGIDGINRCSPPTPRSGTQRRACAPRISRACSTYCSLSCCFWLSSSFSATWFATPGPHPAPSADDVVEE